MRPLAVPSTWPVRLRITVRPPFAPRDSPPGLASALLSTRLGVVTSHDAVLPVVTSAVSRGAGYSYRLGANDGDSSVLWEQRLHALAQGYKSVSDKSSDSRTTVAQYRPFPTQLARRLREVSAEFQAKHDLPI